MASNNNTRIKRKPAPAFPYSSKYPPPDPTDPFASLSALRARAHSSTTALDTPSFSAGSVPDPYSPPRTVAGESRKTHYLFADAQTPDISYVHSTPRHGESEQQRPWYGLAKGYLSDAAKPLRPPKSRKRSAQGRDIISTYLTDVDMHTAAPHSHREPPFAQTPLTQISHNQRRQQERDRRPPSPQPQATSTPREQQGMKEDQHYRRRSRSVVVLSQPDERRASVVLQDQRPVRNAADPQYAYADRQSHGYMFGELENLDLLDGAEHEGEESEMVEGESHPHSHTRFTSQSSGHSGLSEPGRQHTPPMTPDDTVSSINTSPLHTRSRSQSRSVSPQLRISLADRDMPPETPAKHLQRTSVPAVVYDHTDREEDEYMPQSRRNTTVPPDDTPATGVRTIQTDEFPNILLPPPAVQQSPVPPSPVRHQSLAIPATRIAATTRQAESDTELTLSERRRSRIERNGGKLTELRRRIRKPSVGEAQSKAAREVQVSEHSEFPVHLLIVFTRFSTLR